MLLLAPRDQSRHEMYVWLRRTRTIKILRSTLRFTVSPINTHTHTPNTWTEHVYWLCVFMLLWHLWPWTTKPVISSTGIQVHLNKLECCGKVSVIYFSNSTQLKQMEPLPSIEYIYSKWTYFPEGQQFTKNVFFLLVFWIILICWDSEMVGFC